MKTFITTTLSFFCLSCHQASAPQSGEQTKTQVDVHLEIISSAVVPTKWDSTYYQHDTSWSWAMFFDTSAADSFSNVLKSSTLPVSDFWFPNSAFICGVPVRSGGEVIVKFERADSAAHSVNLETGSSFPTFCVQIWRHYKYIRTTAAP